jgi:hypothetical protein
MMGVSRKGFTVTRTSLTRLSVCMWLVVAAVVYAGPAAAQSPQPSADPNPGAMTLTGSFDVVSTHMFRGIRQNATGIALWPVADLHHGEGDRGEGRR